MIWNMKCHQCDRCGSYEYSHDLTDLVDTYQLPLMKWLCKECGHKANSFVNYWGVKKEKDKASLKEYLESGIHYKNIVNIEFSKLMNAGYYDRTNLQPQRSKRT